MSTLLLRQPGIERILVFRALQLGDMLCATPALRALRQAFPRAHIAWAGLPGSQALARRLRAYVDAFLEFPGLAAFPEQAAREQALPDFFRQARRGRYDVALQMHGSGAQSNAIVAQCGARHWGGFVPGPVQQQTGRWLAWPRHEPEPQRYLSLLRHLGIAAHDATLELPLQTRDHREAEALARSLGLHPERAILVHPGARLRSRRWPAERFGAVARALRERGWQVAVTGTPDEAPLCAVVRRMAPDTLDLCGRTTLGGMAALAARCRLVVCNDTGMSHIAAAVRCPSVVIASGSDPLRWAPANRALHTVLATPVPCRPCAYEDCPIGHPCALGVATQAVLEQALRRLPGGPDHG
ncbi:glycosyltransferase family 9 protein [Bordetella genomosp. 6]|uniref:glycosyltransferase family 9 protein n=1 Tax=Bordetella genomosp. 6 TaxID=463024 RepID=UPI000A2911B1|nr:glycosyltransferase family 9 protein [Bordetella genomosp. 6]ARP76496.1 LPS biosynthesis glycosyltransferase [Bordetella genomosp. 6]